MRRIEFTFKTQNYSSGKKQAISRFFKGMSLVCLLLITNWGYQAKAQCALVCNDDVNVSLPGTNAGCTVEVTVDMVLENPQGCPEPLEVSLLTIQGLPLPTSPFINASHIGKTFIYSVTETTSGNSCWGTLKVEDKLGPTMQGCVNLNFPCIIDYKPTTDGGDAPSPVVSDCSGVMTVDYTDVITTNNCGGQGFVAVVQRTWTAVDFKGNVSNCTQTITVERVSLEDYLPVCPPNVSLECTDSIPSTAPSATGYPMIEIDSVYYPVVPGAEVFCELAASYSDEIFDICGGGMKIIRTWNIYDWCLDTDPSIPNPFTCIQVIKVEDKTPPVVVCPAPITVNAIATACAASLNLPPANIHDVCSNWGTKVLTPFGIVNGNGGTILNVPVGTHDIIYVATDDCGNINTCQTTMTVQDKTPPVAVCDEHTTVSLTINGSAVVSAQVFDDGSEDNCDIDYFKVRRMEDVFFEDFVEFYCDDVGTPVLVVMRVWDVAGNYNECMVNVAVQDKIPPAITCPPNKVIQCSDQVPAPETPTIVDNCPGSTWVHSEIDNTTNCGVGTITRIYLATDVGGLQASCTQLITVVNSTPFNLSDIVWPLDYHTYDCGPAVQPSDLPAGYGYPQVNEDACDMVAVTHTDQNLPTNPPACFKVLRKWIVIDWCQYNPNISGSPGYWEYTQIIKVEDDEDPVLTCPVSVVIDGDDPNCQSESVILGNVTATDCSTLFTYQTTVDLFTNGSTDMVFTGPNASATYPFGLHTVTYRVEDKCGNISTCTSTIEVRDAKKPSPVCANGLAVELMSDPVNGGGMITLLPSMFDLGSFDNCTSSADLEFELIPSFFDCDDVGTNVVYLHVTDEAGNTDFCETYVQIQDNMVICPSPLSADVNGGISTSAGNGVNNVTVDVSGNGPFTPSVTTGTNGHFQFIDLSLGNDYTFTPIHNTGYLNGVTTYDLVLMTQHILNVVPFDSPYKHIAGDVNNNGAVTTADVVELRKLILQIVTVFQNNTSWRFVDKDHVFQNPQNPFQPPFPEFFNINNLANDVNGVDFVAVKVGDINGTAITNVDDSIEDRNMTGELTFVTEDQKISAGEVFNVPFRANNFINMFGYQFALLFDETAMELENIEMGELTNLTELNFGLTRIDEGVIATSWDNSKNILHDNNTILFTLTFKASTDLTLSEAIHISKSTLPAEAYQGADGGQIELLDIGLEFENQAVAENAGFELLQNNPNPFTESTTVGFRLPETGQATLTIYDLSGKILATISDTYAKGYNEIILNNDQLGSSGVLFYQLETQGHTATRRMVRL